MHNWFSTSQASSRTTPCLPFIRTISHPIPMVFQNTSHMILNHRVLPQFQIPPTGNLQVAFPQPCHLNFLQTSHLRSLSRIQPLIPVNIKVLSPQYNFYNTKYCCLSYHQNIHLIKLVLILHHPQVFFCLKIRL